MNRRKFVSSAAALAALSLPTTASVALGPSSSEIGSSSESALATGEPINPHGIRTAGIRMLPVVGGKYKVWTKKIGSGTVKVLLLHGGPGFPHDYLEAMDPSSRRLALKCATTTN